MAYDIEDFSPDLTREQRELVRRIMDFEIDPGDHEYTYIRRLAHENGWTVGYAGRVIEEYKRFVALAMVAGHPVTPSEQVDLAWHLHMTYTHSYWTRMCSELLGKPLHHIPTQGGDEQAEHYSHQYEQTLESYDRLFRKRPPSDLWPPAKKRFASPNAEQPKRVREPATITVTRTNLAVHTVLLTLIVSAMLVVAFICGPGVRSAVFAALMIYLVIHIVIVATLLGWISEWTGRGGSGSCGGFSGCGAGCGGGCGGC